MKVDNRKENEKLLENCLDITIDLYRLDEEERKLQNKFKMIKPKGGEKENVDRKKLVVNEYKITKNEKIIENKKEDKNVKQNLEKKLQSEIGKILNIPSTSFISASSQPELRLSSKSPLASLSKTHFTKSPLQHSQAKQRTSISPVRFSHTQYRTIAQVKKGPNSVNPTHPVSSYTTPSSSYITPSSSYTTLLDLMEERSFQGKFTIFFLIS
jgi:hypothetical protein